MPLFVLHEVRIPHVLAGLHSCCCSQPADKGANTCLQRQVFGDTFDLSAAGAEDLPMDALIPGESYLAVSLVWALNRLCHEAGLQHRTSKPCTCMQWAVMQLHCGSGPADVVLHV